MTLMQLLSAGGVTMVVLIICSILSLTIIVERVLYFRGRSREKREIFMADVRRELERNGMSHAARMCKAVDTPFAAVVSAGFSFAGHSEKEISNNMERAIIVETGLLEERTAIVGTIGSTAVYIGLFGTVLGIIRAFMDISVSGGGGINVVIKGISEALVCTAAGLLVAVPAVIAYNYFSKRIDSFVTDMEVAASEAMDLITANGKAR